jgi:hypothetical protein
MVAEMGGFRELASASLAQVTILTEQVNTMSAVTMKVFERQDARLVQVEQEQREQREQREQQAQEQREQREQREQQAQAQQAQLKQVQRAQAPEQAVNRQVIPGVGCSIP